MWISEKIDKGRIRPADTAHHTNGPQAAGQWLLANILNIPASIRPSLEELDEFAAFFSTYLTSSFDVIAKPGTRGAGASTGLCRCPICLRIVQASHLQVKKLSTRDKRRADQLMCDYLSTMATELTLNVAESAIERIVSDSKTRRSAAYVTYGHWLVQRLEGNSHGTAILALWRLIAWDPRGGLRRDFILRLEDFRTAEEVLVFELRGTNHDVNYGENA